MPSPFPGMDPYLEHAEVWPRFHGQFMGSLYQCLTPNLPDRYRARIVCRNYTNELVLFTSVSREEHSEDYFEIRSRSDGQLIALLDLVSPTNKTMSSGRSAYLATRAEAEHAGAALVEIDLILQGQPTLEVDRSALPPHDYRVTITRAQSPGRFEIYATTIQKRLPKFKLPLRSEDRVCSVDLQDVLQRAYDQGGLQHAIDYSADPPGLENMRREVVDWFREFQAVLLRQES